MIYIKLSNSSVTRVDKTNLKAEVKVCRLCIVMFSTTAVLILTVFVAFIVWFLFRRDRQTEEYWNYPPLEQGWIPWLGCALDFGKDPLNQIQAKRKQYGPIFTLYMAGKRMTFLTENEDFFHFFQSPNVDFQEAVAGAVQRTAGIPRSAFFENHTKVHDMVKGRLSSQSLEEIAQNLSKEFCDTIHGIESEFSGDLAELVRQGMYRGVINNLFGKNILSGNEEDHSKFVEHFIKFDTNFEYGSQLPEFLLRDWASSKHWLLGKFKMVMDKALKKDPNNAMTVFQSVVETVGLAESHSFGLLFLWSTLANAIPMTFWTLAHIGANPDIIKKAKEEINGVFGEFIEGKQVVFTEEVAKKLPFVRCCVLEAVRLQSVGTIARKVIQTFKVKGFTIPKGDTLLLSPYWAHRNPKYFPEPTKYNPDRWKEVDLDKKTFLEGFIGFGNGRYQCPGRWFALLEIHMFVSLFLWRFDMKLLKGVPKESPVHLVGTQQPQEPCPVQLRPVNFH